MSHSFSPVILPLDFDTKEEALATLAAIGSDLNWVKVGLQMYLKYGSDFVEELADKGYRIFLDLKLFDIPNTVAGAIQSIGKLPVELLTIHTLGSYEMMKRAVQARNEYAPNLKLIGVTMLTSMDAEQMNRIGIPGEVPGQVLRLAQLSKTHGLDGIVCSPKELVLLKTNIEKEWIYITPGIRPTGTDKQDQRRTTTPAEALEKGSTYLVIGRPITTAPSPESALKSIHQTIGFTNNEYPFFSSK